MNKSEMDKIKPYKDKYDDDDSMTDGDIILHDPSVEIGDVKGKDCQRSGGIHYPFGKQLPVLPIVCIDQGETNPEIFYPFGADIDEHPKLSGHPRFYEIIEEMKQIHSAKNQDYAKESDPLDNLKQCQKIGIAPHIGCFIRMQDKFSRLMNLIGGKEAQVKDESISDTLTDLAVYSVLCRVLWEEREVK